MPPSNNAVLHPANLALQTHALLDETLRWVSDNWLRTVLAIGVAVLIVVILLAIQKAAQRLCTADEPLVSWRTIIGRIAARTRFWFLIIIACRVVDGYADAPATVSSTIRFFFTIGLTFQAALWARELALGYIEHRAGGTDHSSSTLNSAMGIIRVLVTFSLFAVALILILSNLGVNVAGLVAGLGIGGIAIGLAAQGVFADLFAGLSILFDRPFRLGDSISFGSTSGTVEAIGMKSTHIRAATGELIIISNKNLLDKEIQNVTARNHIRLSFTLSVTHETPPATLAKIPGLLRAMGEAEGVTVSRAGFETFSPSAFDFSFVIDVPGDDWAFVHAARDRLLVAIVTGFAQEGVHLAYPTQTSYAAGPDGELVMPYAGRSAAQDERADHPRPDGPRHHS